jgi:hypothetical protein
MAHSTPMPAMKCRSADEVLHNWHCSTETMSMFCGSGQVGDAGVKAEAEAGGKQEAEKEG